MVQIWDFLRSVSVHFGSAINKKERIKKSNFCYLHNKCRFKDAMKMCWRKLAAITIYDNFQKADY